MTPQPILVLDTGSAQMRLALCDGVHDVECRADVPRSSEALIELLERALDEAGRSVHDIGGVVALQGPGSFTGLRVGMAAAMALHAALDVPATAVPTLEAMSLSSDTFPVLCVVHALRQDWFSQPFSGPGVADGEVLRADARTPLRPAERLLGLSAQTLADANPTPFASVEEPSGVAGAVADAARRDGFTWDVSRLMDPMYLSEAATTPPKRRAGP